VTDCITQFFINSRLNRLMQKAHRRLTQFSHNFPSIRASSCINLIDFLTQFSINSGPNRPVEISSTLSQNFSSIREQTDLQKSHQLFDTIFTQFIFNSSELFDAIFLQFVWPADSIGPFCSDRGSSAQLFDTLFPPFGTRDTHDGF
jgi:hypothetical protein